MKYAILLFLFLSCKEKQNPAKIIYIPPGEYTLKQFDSMLSVAKVSSQDTISFYGVSSGLPETYPKDSIKWDATYLSPAKKKFITILNTDWLVHSDSLFLFGPATITFKTGEEKVLWNYDSLYFPEGAMEKIKKIEGYSKNTYIEADTGELQLIKCWDFIGDTVKLPGRRLPPDTIRMKPISAPQKLKQ